MDIIKKSFKKVKEDMNAFQQELFFLKSELSESREIMAEICEIVQRLEEKSNYLSTTYPHSIPTDSTHSSTHDYHFKPLNQQNMPISTGNQGVSTDRQTDRHIDRQTDINKKNTDSIENVVKILDSLDNIKKEIRLKFKRLTEQELVVFITLYQLEEEQGYADYKTISNKLNLTESSIRDYIGRIIKKGIPVDKTKINNKNIQLNISPQLKKITTLPAILQLRKL